jgi:trans-aconitate methyltransferase
MKLSLYLLLFSTFLSAHVGITQVENYKQNSQVQWDLAMESLKDFQFDPEDQVLDIGCGDGKITAFLAAKVPQGTMIGLDISENMIQAATSQFAGGNLSFLQGDAISIPFHNKFDKIVSFCAIHWIIDQEKGIQSMKNSLKSDGTLLLLIPEKAPNTVGLLGSNLACSEKWASYFPAFKQGRVYHTPEEYLTLLNQAGLEVTDLQRFQFVASYPDRAALIAWLTPLVNFVDHLPSHLQQTFIEELTDAYILADPSAPSICHSYIMSIIAKPKIISTIMEL